MLFLGLVSPDRALCEAVAEQVKRTGVWQLAVFSSLAEALEAWSESLPSVLLWDAQDAAATPELIQKLVVRIQKADLPPRLILLGDAESCPIEPADIFTRPLRLGALLGRLQLYEKAVRQTPDQNLVLGPWAFNPRRRTLTPKEGEAQRLTDKEAALLVALYNAPEGVSRDELLEDVWGYNSQADTHTIETHIYRLRRKLMQPDPEAADCFGVEGGLYILNPAWRNG